MLNIWNAIRNSDEDHLSIDFVEFITECRQVLGEAFPRFVDFLLSATNGLVSGEQLCRYTASHIFPQHPHLQHRLRQWVIDLPANVKDREKPHQRPKTEGNEELRPDLTNDWPGGPSYRFVPKNQLLLQEAVWRAAYGNNQINESTAQSQQRSSRPSQQDQTHVLNECYIGTLGLNYEESHPGNAGCSGGGAHGVSTSTYSTSSTGGHPVFSHVLPSTNSNSASLNSIPTLTPGGRTAGVSIRAPMRKPHALEIIESCDDEQFEVDLKMSRLNYLLTVVHSWAKRLGFSIPKTSTAAVADDTDWNVEARGVNQCLVIPPMPLPNSSQDDMYPLLRVALAEVYPQHALTELWKSLKKKPQQTITSIEQRVVLLKENWSAKQGPYAERWSDLRKRFSLRALDYQGPSFRQIDFQRLRPKAVVHNMHVTHQVKQEHLPALHEDLFLPEELFDPHHFADCDWEFGGGSASWLVLRDVFLVINSALQSSTRVDYRNSRRFLNRIKALLLMQISPGLLQPSCTNSSLNNSMSSGQNTPAKATYNERRQNNNEDITPSPKRRRVNANDISSENHVQQVNADHDDHVNGLVGTEFEQNVNDYYNECLKQYSNEPSFTLFYGSENLFLFFYYFWELYDRLMAFYEAAANPIDDGNDIISPNKTTASPGGGSGVGGIGGSGGTRRGTYYQAVQQLLLLARGHCDYSQLEDRVFPFFPHVAYRWLSIDRILNHILRYLQCLRSQNCTRSLLFTLRRHDWQRHLENIDDIDLSWMKEIKKLDKMAWDYLSGSVDNVKESISKIGLRGAAERTRAADRDALVVTKGLFRFYWFWPQRRMLMRWFPNREENGATMSIIRNPSLTGDSNKTSTENVDNLSLPMPKACSPIESTVAFSPPYLKRNLVVGLQGILNNYYNGRRRRRMLENVAATANDSSDSSNENDDEGNPSSSSPSSLFNDITLPSFLMDPPEDSDCKSLCWLPVGAYTNSHGCTEHVLGSKSLQLSHRQIIRKERQLCYALAVKCSAFRHISRQQLFGNYILSDDTELHYWPLQRRFAWAKGFGFIFYRCRDHSSSRSSLAQHEEYQAKQHLQMELFLRKSAQIVESDCQSESVCEPDLNNLKND